MSNVNIGNQSITFQYYQEAKSRSFNELLYKVVPQGILDGGEISIISDTVISLDKFSLVIEVPTETNDIEVKISTREIIQLLPTEENCYIVGEYNWLDFKDNYMDIKCVKKSAILSNYIIFGKIEYINGIPNSIDYTERTLSKLYDVTHNDSNFLVTTYNLSKNILVKKGKAFIGGKLISLNEDYFIDNIFEEVNYGMIIKVYIGQDGIPNYVRGEDSEDYIEPNIPNNTILLAIIRIPPNASVILGDYITQVRDFDINTPIINTDDNLNRNSTNPISNSTVTEKFELVNSYMQDDKSSNNKLTTESYVDNTINTNLTSRMGKANGIATLDENGRIPYSQLAESALEWKGEWNAETNIPTLADGVGTLGDMYIVTVPSKRDLGSGEIDFLVGNRVVYNGTVWQNISSGSVTSVNNIKPISGNINLGGDNIPLSNSRTEYNINDIILEGLIKPYVGFKWQKVTNPQNVSEIVANSRVLVGKISNKVSYSLDSGNNWTVTEHDASGCTLYELNEKFFVLDPVKDNWTDESGILYSADGVNYRRANVLDKDGTVFVPTVNDLKFYSIDFYNGQYVFSFTESSVGGLGRIFVSSDGITFNELDFATLPSTQEAVADGFALSIANKIAILEDMVVLLFAGNNNIYKIFTGSSFNTLTEVNDPITAWINPVVLQVVKGKTNNYLFTMKFESSYHFTFITTNGGLTWNHSALISFSIPSASGTFLMADKPKVYFNNTLNKYIMNIHEIILPQQDFIYGISTSNDGITWTLQWYYIITGSRLPKADLVDNVILQSNNNIVAKIKIGDAVSYSGVFKPAEYKYISSSDGVTFEELNISMNEQYRNDLYQIGLFNKRFYINCELVDGVDYLLMSLDGKNWIKLDLFVVENKFFISDKASVFMLNYSDMQYISSIDSVLASKSYGVPVFIQDGNVLNIYKSEDN